MFDKRWGIVFAMCCMTAAAAFGQDALHKLDVELSDNQCEGVTGVTAVIKEDREVFKEMTKIKTRKCGWLLNTGATTRVAWLRTPVSLRIESPTGRFRTNCVDAQWDETGSTFAAKFVFLQGKQVTITPDPQSGFWPYVREVPAFGNKGILCGEGSTLGVGSEPWTVTAVNIDQEKLRLTLFQSPTDLCGLVVNALRKARKTAKTGGTVEIHRNEIS